MERVVIRGRPFRVMPHATSYAMPAERAVAKVCCHGQFYRFDVHSADAYSHEFVLMPWNVSVFRSV